jgi:hypothetical protein
MLSWKVHKNDNLFGSDFEFCTISLLVISGGWPEVPYGSCGPNIARWDEAELHIFSFPYKVNASSDSHFGGGSNLRTSTIAFSHLYVGTHTLYRKIDLCIPRNHTMRPRSQFLHSCTVNLCLVTIKYKNPSCTNITVPQKYVFDFREYIYPINTFAFHRLEYIS